VNQGRGVENSAILEVLEAVKNMKGDISEKIETLVRGVVEVVTKGKSL